MRAVHRLAAEAETACRAGEAGRAAQCAYQLAAQLQALRANAAVLLSVASDEAEAEVLPGDAGADPQLLVELSNLLRQRSLAALAHFSAAATPLRRLLGKPAYELLRDHIDKLQFDDAARVLGEAGGHDLARGWQAAVGSRHTGERGETGYP